MKEIISTSYTCDICGAVYSSAEECQECESSHAIRASIAKMKFRRREELPYKIHVEINGDIYEYLLDPRCVTKLNRDIEEGINKLFKGNAHD